MWGHAEGKLVGGRKGVGRGRGVRQIVEQGSLAINYIGVEAGIDALSAQKAAKRCEDA